MLRAVHVSSFCFYPAKEHLLYAVEVSLLRLTSYLVGLDLAKQVNLLLFNISKAAGS